MWIREVSRWEVDYDLPNLMENLPEAENYFFWHKNYGRSYIACQHTSGPGKGMDIIKAAYYLAMQTF